MQKVYIPLSVTCIESLDLSAGFTFIDHIDIYYEGTEEQWGEIDKNGYWYGYNEPIMHFETTPADMHS